ncbi:hypothetical protein KDM41_14600 [bacterium]|nr:hypothetical protein [bacterium]
MTNIAPATPGRHFRLNLLLLAVVGVSLLGLAACSEDKATVNFPRTPAEESQKWLFDVTGNSASDIYVAGNIGAMFHFDGATWTAQDMGTTAAITTLWTSPLPGENTVYAAGHGGRIWRNTGSAWSSMTSGTQANLYGMGMFANQLHAVGAKGAIRRLSGSTWSGAGGTMFQLDENGSPIDTLSTTEDLSSLLAVNTFFLGGAYFDPKYEGQRFGTLGTKGTVLAANTDAALIGPWILRPLSGEVLVEDEWVMCMTNDPADLSRNYLGTSEGWLFRIVINDEGNRVWKKFYPEFSIDPGAGIRDIWVDDATGDVYLVTDEGKVWFQTADYSFADDTGTRELLYDEVGSFVSIWGTGPDNLYFTGYFDEKIFHGDHDTGAGTFTVTEIPLAFPAKSAASDGLAAGLNEKGLPLR